MFKSISWEEYLFAVGCLAAGYYVIAVAIFYSRDIVAKLKGESTSKAKPEISKSNFPQGKFMGSISTSVRKQIPTKQSIASSEELSFESQPEELLAANRADSAGVDMMDALEEVFMYLASKKKDKATYVEKITRLVQQRPEFSGTPVQQEVVSFIHEYFKGNQSISFSVEELESLWLSANGEVIHQSTTKNNYEK
ncbi:hypothetical protein [Pseudochryseolinea flava]|uniref:Uncharacterized protein n=1 Tax=Pseudochryseolinea flava TaxID=2059302 RepID=A0A364XU33_9BACT|nr:hypothetical protein [Pseudochryseolinea flava]RAV97649.1 hypothetical protein DQQ10_27445 [Pseudochryseolinea flava]